jgi:hypothetical protein
LVLEKLFQETLILQEVAVALLGLPHQELVALVEVDLQPVENQILAVVEVVINLLVVQVSLLSDIKAKGEINGAR